MGKYSKAGHTWLYFCLNVSRKIIIHNTLTALAIESTNLIQKPKKVCPDLEWNPRHTMLNRFHYNMYDFSRTKTTFTVRNSSSREKLSILHPQIFSSLRLTTNVDLNPLTVRKSKECLKKMKIFLQNFTGVWPT